MSDRNTSPASTRSNSSSLSAGQFVPLQILGFLIVIKYFFLVIGGSQKYDGPTKLDFSFTSNGEDEGIPDELYEVIRSLKIFGP